MQGALRAGGRGKAWGVAGLGALAALGLALGWWLLRPEPPSRIVLIVVDTLRRDHLSPYGALLRTPNVQALAERGQVFTNALASFHQTSMSMGALFSGHTPSIESEREEQPLGWNGHAWCGLARFADDDPEGACVPPGVRTLAEALRDEGYYTIGIASNPLLHEPSGFAAGFLDWVEVRPARRVGSDDLADGYRPVGWREVNRDARAALARRPHDHFFLYVHYMDVHDYFLNHESYARAVERVDEGVGELLDGLRAGGLLEDARVIFTADHGERLAETRPVPMTRRHFGNPSFQELLRIPLLIAPATALDPQQLLRSEDLHRLILSLAGVEARPGEDLAPDELFLSELRFRTYLKGRWKLIEARNRARVNLYDLVEDPGEQRDLAAAHPEIVAEQRARAGEIAGRLRARATERGLSELERRRLEALGYLDEPSP